MIAFIKSFATLITITLINIYVSLAQSSTPSPPGGHGSTGNQPAGGGAPIEGGYLLLTMLGVAYGLRKWHSACQRKGKNEEYRESV